MTTEVRCITLSSSDINASVNINDYATTAISNATGTIGPQFQYMIWNNINLENMVGSAFFNKYTKFKIRLLHCSICDLCGNSTYGFDTNIVTRIQNANINLLLSGLDFNPSPYSHTNPTNTKVSIMTNSINQLPSSATAIPSFTTPSNRHSTYTSFRFNKPTGNVTLQIDRMIISTNTYAPITNAFGYGHFKFLFEVSGST
jgi:hypothetical protein